MRKFAWIFMAAMTVAGFSACSNTEDDPLPGLGGGDGDGDGTGSSVMITDTIYQFNNIVDQYVAINELCPGWGHEIVSPADDDRTWQSKIFTSGSSVDKYIQATAHDSSDKNAGKTYDLWMFSPALNVKDAPKKVFSFYSEGAYWQSTSSLEVYLLNEPKSNASSKELLNVKIATSADGQYTWVASGDISLEGKGDVVYVGFRYQAQGGKSNSTTYIIDDFAFGRSQVEHFIGTEDSGDDNDDPVSPDTPEVDWTSTINVADALTYDNAQKTVIAVKGYIVGCLKSGAKSNIADVTAAASEVEMGVSTYTGSTTVIIADNADETDLSKCLWVKLNDQVSDYPGAAGLRDAVSLKDNPGNIGKVLYVKGKKMAMFTGLPGVRDIEGWKLGE